MEARLLQRGAAMTYEPTHGPAVPVAATATSGGTCTGFAHERTPRACRGGQAGSQHRRRRWQSWTDVAAKDDRETMVRLRGPARGHGMGDGHGRCLRRVAGRRWQREVEHSGLARCTVVVPRPNVRVEAGPTVLRLAREAHHVTSAPRGPSAMPLGLASNEGLGLGWRAPTLLHMEARLLQRRAAMAYEPDARTGCSICGHCDEQWSLHRLCP